MGVPSREARQAHARQHCELWNAGKKDEFVASWRTIAMGDVTMFDPVGTKAKHGFEYATSHAFDMFQPCTKMEMLTVKVNGKAISVDWPYPDSITDSPRTIAIPVPLDDLVAGDNTQIEYVLRAEARKIDSKWRIKDCDAFDVTAFQGSPLLRV